MTQLKTRAAEPTDEWLRQFAWAIDEYGNACYHRLSSASDARAKLTTLVCAKLSQESHPAEHLVHEVKLAEKDARIAMLRNEIANLDAKVERLSQE